MTQLFLPVIQSFTGIVAAGSGVVNQWVYTVPAGKRSIIRDVFCEVVDNANAVNTTWCDIFITIGAPSHTIVRQYNDGAGNNTLTPNIGRQTHIELPSGAGMTGRTTNTGAAGVSMVVRAFLEEYSL